MCTSNFLYAHFHFIEKQKLKNVIYRRLNIAQAPYISVHILLPLFHCLCIDVWLLLSYYFYQERWWQRRRKNKNRIVPLSKKTVHSLPSASIFIYRFLHAILMRFAKCTINFDHKMMLGDDFIILFFLFP